MLADLLNQIAQNGPAFAILVAAVGFFYFRDKRNDVKADKRETEIQARCDEERKDLTERVRQLEERQHDMSVNMFARLGELMTNNTSVLERFLEKHGSGAYITKDRP
jgi:hypothetical protein